ncbi:MAG: DNA polymerase III subunit alpha [Micrococcaceae bacterium]
MSESSFVHLHNHTEYSMLDGAARITDLFKKVKSFDMPAVAMTDHGNMFGSYEFWKAGKIEGVKPIIGIEAYLTPNTSRFERKRVRWGDDNSNTGDDVSGAGAYTHMTMWAENTPGMHNLFRLASLASIEGTYYKARMDRELLQTYGKGIIATTGCPGGEVQTRLRLGQYDEARKAAGEFQDIFGKDNFFCELMDHNISVERRVKEDLLRLAKELNIPLVATNDLHYVEQSDAKAHSALLCVQSGSTLQDPKRFQFDGDGYYVKSAAEMRQIFKDVPEACDNTLKIAERCNVEFNESANYMPKFDVPVGETEESWFIKEVEKGLHYRYPEGITDEVRNQANYETEVISNMGFTGYFLVVADFINWAKDNGIKVGPGRGSGAGSIVAYAMRITELDPLQHGLIFERFLNPDRVSMPDFDVDFDDRRRGEVIQYVTDKYGDERVAQIVTYGTIKSKQALKDAARVLGHEFSVGETLTKAMPETVMGKDVPINEIYNKDHVRYKEGQEFRETVESQGYLKEVFDTALGLEGLKRQWGVHAAGVIMSSDPLMDIIPLMKREQDGQIITQFDYPTCEALGLIKMDFLGLRNLTIIDDALVNIKSNVGDDIDLEKLTFDDPKAYELLARGDTLGVFQLDGGPMRNLLKLMRPDNFEDISAVIALYRPGPMGANSHNNYALRKIGQQKIEPIHPELAEPLKDILDTTYGLIVYQEQVMAIAQKVAGYSLGQADILRRAMGKKKKSELDKQYVDFKAGMINNGFSENAVKTLWDILLPFSDYAFNKAHSAAYGVISYWTAYLKANYPVEYMAALLSSVGADSDKMALYLNECRHMGITVLTPDINESSVNFTAVGGNIRFGLGAVRNVGALQVGRIQETIAEKGKFTDFKDFMMKIPQSLLNKRSLYSIVKSGAFDSFGHTRRSLERIVEDAIDSVTNIKKNESIGQFDLFGAFSEENDGDTEIESIHIDIPDIPEWDRKTKLANEREVLGMYVSDHPLKGMEHAIDRYSDLAIQEIIADEHIRDRQQVRVAGLITSIIVRRAKASNKEYARVELEDTTGSMEVMFFNRVYEPIATLLQEDMLVSIDGRISKRDDGSLSIMASSMEILDGDKLLPPENQTFILCFDEDAVTEESLEHLMSIFKEHPGKRPVKFKVSTKTGIKVLALPDNIGVSGDTDFIADIKADFGRNAIEL